MVDLFKVFKLGIGEERKNCGAMIRVLFLSMSPGELWH